MVMGFCLKEYYLAMYLRNAALLNFVSVNVHK